MMDNRTLRPSATQIGDHLAHRHAERRAYSFDRSGVPVSADGFVTLMGWDKILGSSSGVAVTVERALGVPAVWDAVNFIAGTLARLGLYVYRKKGMADRERIGGAVADMLADAVNDETTSFDWRKYTFDQVLTEGRGLTYIERNAAGNPINLFPLDVGRVQVRRKTDNAGRVTTVYEHSEGGKVTEYLASEIIDLRFMQRADRLAVRSPIRQCREAIGQAIAASEYAAKIFQKGGIPPMTLEGPFGSGEAARRAAEDVARAMEDAAASGRPILSLPAGHSLNSPAFNAEQLQMLEFRNFLTLEIARIYQLPPVFLQDLQHGTFANTEQQDLQLVKHTLMRWIEQTEQELTLKLFGRGSRRLVEFNVDRVLRGDFKTRMEGKARAIQTGQLTPNEARQEEGRPALEGGDRLMIQGATVPLTEAGKVPAPAPASPTKGDDDGA